MIFIKWQEILQIYLCILNNFFYSRQIWFVFVFEFIYNTAFFKDFSIENQKNI